MLRPFDGEQGWYGPLPQLLSDVGVGLVVERSGQVVLVNDTFCVRSTAGRIWVDSTPGLGTTVVAELPAG